MQDIASLESLLLGLNRLRENHDGIVQQSGQASERLDALRRSLAKAAADLKRQTAEIDDLQARAARKQAAIIELDAQTGHAQGLVTALENECSQLDQQLSARLQDKQRLRADIKAKAVAFAEAPLPKEAEQHMLATRQLREERELLVGRMRHR